MSSLYEAFRTRAEAVSAEVHRFPNKGEALEFVVGFLRSENISDSPRARAVWANGPFLNDSERAELSAQVPGLSFNVTRDLAAEAKAGISQMEWAMSDTGTLVQDAGPVDRRLVSTLPTIHIALVPTGGIQPGMAQVLTRIRPSHSGYISMITGPSRTADIERVLTIGVHGPSRLVIVFVDEWGKAQ